MYGECDYDGTHRYPKTGKARPHRRPPSAWPVCLPDHHEGYIAWEDYLASGQRLHHNWFRSTIQGAPREGTALLQGLIGCGRCGAKMSVNSHSVKENRRPSYVCNHAYYEGAASTT